MNSKTNEILNDIIHTASQAILSEDEAIKRQAMADIVDGLASVIPADHGVYRTPPHVVDFIANLTNVPFVGEFQPDYLKKIAEKYKLVPAKDGYSKFLTAADGVRFARFSNDDWVKLIAKRQAKNGNSPAVFEIFVDKKGKLAEVYRNDELMFKIEGRSFGHSMVEKLAISAMHRYFKENQMANEKKKRKRARIAAEKAELERSARRSDPTTEPTMEELENA